MARYTGPVWKKARRGSLTPLCKAIFNISA